MRKILAIFKTPTIRTALFCAVFCATTLCPAQETARGIVAEKIDTVKNDVERPEPEIRFFDADSHNEVTIKAASFDFKYIVVFDRLYVNYNCNIDRYMIMDLKTGYKIREVVLNRNMDNTIGFVSISDDNKFMKILYNDETYIYSVESGQEVFNIQQNFTGYINVDKDIEEPPFADDKELYEIYKSKWNWARDDNSKLYYSDWDPWTVIDAVDKKIYEFSHPISMPNNCRAIYIYDYDDRSIAVAYHDGYIMRYSSQGTLLNTYKLNNTDQFDDDMYMRQQDNFLIVANKDKVYIYDLYSGELLKFSDLSEVRYWCDINYLYFNNEENFFIIIDEVNPRWLSGKYDDNSFTPIPFEEDDNTFVDCTIHLINGIVYFLTFNNNLEAIIKKWNPSDNTIESIKTGVFFFDETVDSIGNNFSYYFNYNENDNTLYANIVYDDENRNRIIKYIIKCDLITKKCSSYYPEEKFQLATFMYTDDVDTVLLYKGDYSCATIINLKDFKPIESSDFSKDKIKDLIAGKSSERDSPSIMVLTANGTLCKYDNKGKCIAKYASQAEYRKSQDYQPYYSLTEYGITVSDWYSGNLLYYVGFLSDGESLIYTPEGFFCGSEWATQNLVYIVDGMDVIGIDQVYDTYYRPDLVAAKMRGEDISAYASSVRLASLVRSGRAPAVSLLGIPAESSGRDMTFDISVQNTGGGIGAVNLLLNGKAIRLSDGIASADGEIVSFRHTVTLQNGSNTLEAFALNGAGLVESVRSSAQVVWRGATEKPDLYVLTAAINRYRDKSLWLNYAVPDAQSVAAGFQKQKSGLYRNVYVSQLNDGEVTKEKLAVEFSRLSEHIRADDVFVFFVSGHGTTYDDGDYYYLPSDFRYTSKDSIPNGGISKNDLLANLSKIKAGKTLVMLDTCNSGAFLSDSNKRGLSEKTAIDRLTRATGHATLAASSDTQSAMEGYNGHGVFTYVFLEGIAGAADSDDDGYVTLNELSTFVEREVPERSYEKWGYEQVPQKDLRRQDFPIAGK